MLADVALDEAYITVIIVAFLGWAGWVSKQNLKVAETLSKVSTVIESVSKRVERVEQHIDGK